MKDKEHNELFDKLLKDNLSNKTSEVPAFVWENIEKNTTKKRKKRILFWFISVGLIIGISSLAIYVYEYQNKKIYSEHVKVTDNEISTLKSKDKNALIENIESNNVSENPKSITEESKVKESKKSHTKTTTSSVIAAEVKTKNSANKQNENSNIINKNTNSNTGVLKNKEVLLVDNSINKRKVNATSSTQTASGIQKNNLGKRAIVADEIKPASVSDSKINLNSEYLKLLKNNYLDNQLIIDELDFSNFNYNSIVLKDSIPPLQNKAKYFSLIANVGLSMYDIAIYKSYFTSGQLSNRDFKSSGYEFSLGLNYNFNPKFSMYSLINYNYKQTTFNYDLAIDEKSFYNYYLNSQLVPIENLDNQNTCNCHTAKDVSASYKIKSLLFSIGTTYKILQLKKLSASIDLRLNSNIQSSLVVKNYKVLSGFDNKKESVNMLKPGLGILLNYQISKKIQLGISPIYMIQFNSNNKTFYSKIMKEFIIPININYKL